MNGPNNEQFFERNLYCSAKQIAKELNVSTRTLGLWRQQGSGPPFRRFANKIVYKWDDVKKWVEDFPSYTSTADYEQQKQRGKRGA